MAVFLKLFMFIMFFMLSFIFNNPSIAANDKGGDIGDIATPGNSSVSPPPDLMSSQKQAKIAPFKPEMAVIVAILTTLFSVTFLVLLYAKHCKRGRIVVVAPGTRSSATAAGRKNSGIDRGVVESLPVFRFRSLRGQKEGLECAVCLTRFEPTEVLRLLPKCKHAFHVECVDTWLDAHSTCPLCRYRVDPEDILLVDETQPPPDHHHEHEVVLEVVEENTVNDNPLGYRRLSGRHSSAGEERTRVLASQRLDPTSFRRSLDSAAKEIGKESESVVAVGCFDHLRKDGLLTTTSLDRVNSSSSSGNRLEHRIIVSSNPSGIHQRWSDVQPSDLLYLRSEMIMSDSRRFLSTSKSRTQQQQRQQQQQQQHSNNINNGWRTWWSGGGAGGRHVINDRSVSEITGLSRFPNRGTSNSSHQ
ncbi:RING-H2 finger protein ATL43 [Fagus crenata]